MKLSFFLTSSASILLGAVPGVFSSEVGIDRRRSMWIFAFVCAPALIAV
jgi:hypothetical protein